MGRDQLKQQLPPDIFEALDKIAEYIERTGDVDGYGTFEDYPNIDYNFVGIADNIVKRGYQAGWMDFDLNHIYLGFFGLTLPELEQLSSLLSDGEFTPDFIDRLKAPLRRFRRDTLIHRRILERRSV